MAGPLAGKTAIVTGSAKATGIGAAAALALAKDGANIVIHYSSSVEPAQNMVKKIEELGVKAVAVQADASAADFGTKLVSGALSGLNTDTIDILVNNAGAAAGAPSIAAIEIDSFDQMFHINVRGPFLLIQAALPHMKSGGRIINVGSIAGKMGIGMLAFYGASKGALVSMSNALAEELGPKGITINVVAPGPISTDMSASGSPVMTKLHNNAHIKREGTPEEVGYSIAMLASPLAGYITGQLIPVDGGIGWA